MAERDHLGEAVDRVSNSDASYTITKNGVDVAVILGFERYESMIETLDILSDDDTMAALDEARAERER